MNGDITKKALKGMAIAMGIAVSVMSVLNTLNINAGVTMLGIGLAALALTSLQKERALP